MKRHGISQERMHAGARAQMLYGGSPSGGKSMLADLANSRRVIGYLVLFKVTYLILLSAGLLLRTESEKGGITLVDLQNGFRNWRLTIKPHLMLLDAGSYLMLSEKGYKQGLRDCAFYPLYPLLIRWVSLVTGGHDFLVALALSNLFSFVAFLLFFGMTARRFGKSEAKLALVLLLAFPGSLFFQFVYTESLFLLLLMLFCLALEREYRTLAFVVGFLLPLTRAVGIFCVFPLLWSVFFKWSSGNLAKMLRRAGWMGRFACFVGQHDSDAPALKSLNWGGMITFCLVLAPILGWATYFLLMWKWTGNAFEGMEAQKQFGVQSINNLFAPLGFFTQLLNPTSWHEFRGSLLDRCVFVLLINCLPVIWKLDKSWCVWAFFLGVVPAVSGGFTSFTRFASVVFPLFIALGVLLSKPEKRWLRWLVLCTFALLHLILVWRFVNLRWAG
jgi:hypothetical protein